MLLLEKSKVGVNVSGPRSGNTHFALAAGPQAGVTDLAINFTATTRNQ